MALKIVSVILLVTLFQVQNIESWPYNPWLEAGQSLSFGRQQTSIAINGLHRQISWKISSVMRPLSWKLNLIQNQAKLQSSECAQKILIDIDQFFASQNWHQSCRKDSDIDLLRAQQMQKIDALYNKLNIAQGTCADQECVDQTTKAIQDALAQIKEETNVAVNQLGEEMTDCVQDRSGNLVQKANEIEENWKLC